ncbi:MAG TPA: putative peptidoglycan glycosyltransferase FtsW [Chthoniobacterales bacterium]|jgi:cell division protein FtsW|nr:putative peptidoglycan glycosyltransferase FtsW [Chthoniobacterales bacterium]
MHKQSAYILVLAVAVLVTIGLVMLYSTGAFAPDSHGDQFNFLKKQSFWLGVGFLFSILFALLDYHRLERSWYVLFPIALGLLTLCFIRPVGMRINGSWRWIHAGPVTFQPSELAKLVAIIFIAWWFSKFEAKCKGILMGLIYPVLAVVTLLVPIVMETDLGTTLLIGGTVLLIMFVAGASPKYLGPLVVLSVAALLGIAWHISERQGRLLAFLHPDQYQEKEGHQQWMGLIAFGSGGAEGLGLGNGRQKMLYLPYAHTDFIFPVIGEELGLRVTLVVVFCYLLIVTSGILISLNAKDRFGMLLGFGCTAILGLQAAINVGVTTSLFPNKGLPLPFISYGGSNIFFCLVCIGILINIYRQGKEDKTTANTEMMVRIRHVSRI